MCIKLNRDFYETELNISGSTFVAFVFTAETNRLVLINVGDSRCIFRNGDKIV